MIYIAHRGNLNGPNKERENAPDYIIEAINKGYYVEVDVWYIDGNFFLGHDSPDYKIEINFLKNKNFYCHTKNLGAIKELINIKNEINFFSHELDEFVLTSDNKIWTFPGADLCENSICCMPEKKNQYPDGCYGVCTDYPIKYKLMNELKYGNSYDFENSFNYIYKKMKEKNILTINNIGLNIDYHLNMEDERRCFGISTYLSSKSFNEDFKLMITDLNNSFKGQVIYDDSEKNVGTSHFSFINIISFEKFNDNKHYIDQNYQNYKLILDEIFEPFKIYWKGVIAIPTGICMIGIPDVDVNKKREIFREKINEKKLKMDERYKTDIIHSTLLRLSKEEDKKKIFDFCKKYENTYFGLSEITDIKLIRGSWLANETKSSV